MFYFIFNDNNLLSPRKASNRSPCLIGPTPSGVPVKRRSPFLRVIKDDTKAMILSTVKSINAVCPFWRISPLICNVKCKSLIGPKVSCAKKDSSKSNRNNITKYNFDAGKFLFDGDFHDMKAVFWAHLSFYKSLPKRIKIRKEQQARKKTVHIKGIYNRSIVADYYLLKKKYFSQLNTNSFT